MKNGFDLPYQPIPQKLYTNSDLFDGYNPEKPLTWVETNDFKIYHHFITGGSKRPINPYLRMMQSLHDNAISQLTDEFIAGKRMVAIIGDHQLGRNSSAYRKTANLARMLTRKGYTICTCGGPGAMEASHLGAALTNSNDADLDNALELLKTIPDVPNLRKIIHSNGKISNELVLEAEKWFNPAFNIARSLKSAGESLAIPTWHYGHEPSTPFATHIAKYFQNSIREDGLVTIAQNGIVCVEGSVGTIQELFQETTQNYYQADGKFSPMVILGEEYWTQAYPVVEVLKALFKEKFSKFVLVTDEVEASVSFIQDF